MKFLEYFKSKRKEQESSDPEKFKEFLTYLKNMEKDTRNITSDKVTKLLDKIPSKDYFGIQRQISKGAITIVFKYKSDTIYVSHCGRRGHNETYFIAINDMNKLVTFRDISDFEIEDKNNLDQVYILLQINETIKTIFWHVYSDLYAKEENMK